MAINRRTRDTEGDQAFRHDFPPDGCSHENEFTFETPLLLKPNLMTQHGPWKIVASHEIYRDAWIRLQKDDVIRPDGKPGTYSVVTLKPGVTVLAMDEDDNIYLRKSFITASGGQRSKGPAAASSRTSGPLDAAKRELQEELGIEADDWTDLGVVDPFTASVVSPTRLYLARKLHFGPQTLDEDRIDPMREDAAGRGGREGRSRAKSPTDRAVWPF